MGFRIWLIGLLFLGCLGRVEAQIPMHEEPFHQPVLTIPDYIRVINLEMEPGDTSAFHVHAHNMWFYTLNGTQMWLQSPGEEGRTVELKTGFHLEYPDYHEHPFTHRIANVGTEKLKVLAVENLNPPGLSRNLEREPVKTNELHLSKEFVVWQVVIPPHKKQKLNFNQAVLIVNLAEVESKVKLEGMPWNTLQKQGSLVWTGPSWDFSLKNPGKKELSMLVVGVK
ncbi:MAG: hypothetical protein H6581_27250 [Bacteroidia bacterium]|nr:hypothetical protein [Bacteroidia bacterium]